MGANRFLFLCVLTQLVMRQVIKFVYIFKFKWFMSMDEDFAAQCLTLCNIVLCAVVAMTTQLLGFHNAEVDFHVCLGKDPNETIRKTFQYMNWGVHGESKIITTFEEVTRKDPLSYLVIFLLILLSIVCILTLVCSGEASLKETLLRLKAIAVKHPPKDLPTLSNNHNFEHPPIDSLPLSNNHKFEETKNEIIGTVQVLIATAFCLIVLIPYSYARAIVKVNADDLNHGIGKSLFYIGRMTMPLVAYFNIPLLIIFNNHKMRRTLVRELRNQFSFSSKISDPQYP